MSIEPTPIDADLARYIQGHAGGRDEVLRQVPVLVTQLVRELVCALVCTCTMLYALSYHTHIYICI